MTTNSFDIILHQSTADGSLGAHLIYKYRGRSAVFCSNINSPPNFANKTVALVNFIYTPAVIAEYAKTARNIVVFLPTDEKNKFDTSKYEHKNVEIVARENTTATDIIMEWLPLSFDETITSWILDMIRGKEPWASAVSAATSVLGYHTPEKIVELLGKENYTEFEIAGKLLEQQRTGLVKLYAESAILASFNADRFKNLDDVVLAVANPPVFLLQEVAETIFANSKADVVLCYLYIFDNDTYEMRFFFKKNDGIANLVARQLPVVHTQGISFIDGSIYGKQANLPSRLEAFKGETIYDYVTPRKTTSS